MSARDSNTWAALYAVSVVQQVSERYPRLIREGLAEPEPFRMSGEHQLLGRTTPRGEHVDPREIERIRLYAELFADTFAPRGVR